ncbi:coiled-coil-helix-coiled-coil-helix domain-containing protein 1 [Rhinatrema bivittatum]|uniref:coiled-coil-helix-coiled-coil-helix domain-containing protein 1 n=1 Tax=Rhinatrema bivittatum TaxID=194408 RepID=UPI00112ECD54|nr:coiled-coil-helix-coiled-coil-helix domain-containing protein 1 [Rhinatrema bivittatum]
MAKSGAELQAYLYCLVSRRLGKPVLRPSRPLVLADKVANRKARLGEATCLTEMSLMMACWKQNNFSDAACVKEIQSFFDCNAKAQAEHRATRLSESGRLPPKQVNKLLKMFPNIRHEI